MTDIVDLLGMLAIFGAGAAAGILLMIKWRSHERAEGQSAWEAESFQDWSRGGLGPSGVDPHDRTFV